MAGSPCQIHGVRESTVIRDALRRVSTERLRKDLYSLCRDPLPYRKVNYTRPGSSMNSLAEADAYIRSQLEEYCGLDTQGMVDIVRVLGELVKRE